MTPLLRYAVFTTLVGCVEVVPLVKPFADDEGGQGGSEAGQGGGGGLGGQGGMDGQGGQGGQPALPVCGSRAEVECVRPTALVPGGFHTCAEMDDGSVRCWGSNDSHQLGDPTTPMGLFARGTIEGVEADDEVALGLRHGCARIGTTVGCWGRNTLGQLGTGDYVFRKELTPILNDAVTLATGDDSSCAIRESGSVVCWGIRANGQSWTDGDLGEHSLVPTAVSGVTAPAELAIGGFHACAIRGDRMGVDCWGDGNEGQLGNGQALGSAVPVAVSGLALPVAQLVSASESACSLGGDPPVVACWGLLPDGQVNPSPTPLAPQPNGEVLELGAGWRHACALLAHGEVQCWGINSYGALGYAGDHSAQPVTVVGVTDAIDLAVGQNHGCALRDDGVVLCWGRNDAGQLGRATVQPLDPIAAPVKWP